MNLLKSSDQILFVSIAYITQHYDHDGCSDPDLVYVTELDVSGKLRSSR
jgi:hypothetical protein